MNTTVDSIIIMGNILSMIQLIMTLYMYNIIILMYY